MCNNDFIERVLMILWLEKKIASLSPFHFFQYKTIYALLAQDGLMITPIFDQGHWFVAWRNPLNQKVYIADTWKTKRFVNMRHRKNPTKKFQKILIEAYRLRPELEDILVTIYWNKPLIPPNEHGERKRATYYVVDVQIQKDEWVCGWYASLIMILLAKFNGEIDKITKLQIPENIT